MHYVINVLRIDRLKLRITFQGYDGTVGLLLYLGLLGLFAAINLAKPDIAIWGGKICLNQVVYYLFDAGTLMEVRILRYNEIVLSGISTVCI